MDWLEENDPKLHSKLQNLAHREDMAGRSSTAATSEFMQKQGFVRVVGGKRDGNMYITGNPTPAQRRQLVDAAIEAGVPLTHDLGGGRSRLMHDPEAFSKAADKPQMVHEYGPDGKVVSRMEIPDGSSEADLTAAIETVKNSRVSDASKIAMTQAVAGEARRPHQSGNRPDANAQPCRDGGLAQAVHAEILYRRRQPADRRVPSVDGA
jgi:hypothetical protein